MRVVLWNPDIDLPPTPFIRCSFDSLHDRGPVQEVVFRDGFEGLETGVRVFVVVVELIHKAFGNGDTGSGCHCCV